MKIYQALEEFSTPQSSADYYQFCLGYAPSFEKALKIGIQIMQDKYPDEDWSEDIVSHKNEFGDEIRLRIVEVKI